MLNPLAHEFSPTSFEPNLPTHSNNNNKKNARKAPPLPPPKKDTTAVESEKKGTKEKGKQVLRKNQPKDTTKKQGKKLKEDDGGSNNSSKNKGKEASKKKKDIRRPSVPTAIPASEFEQESSFITIEAAIDPVHRLDNIASDSRRKSLTQNVKKQYEHGYERYIDWIDRSLQIYGIITVVGMDKAIVDVISIVTILQDRKIGEHQDIETFTMNQGNKPISCIQVKLHPFYLYKQ